MWTIKTIEAACRTRFVETGGELTDENELNASRAALEAKP